MSHMRCRQKVNFQRKRFKHSCGGWTWGLPWPEEAAPTATGSQEEFDLKHRKSEFWLWQLVADVEAPKVNDEPWPRNDIDRHILARLEEAGLKPSHEADRTAILRRLYFDLIGLPPTPEEVAAFIADKEEGAIERGCRQAFAVTAFWGTLGTTLAGSCALCGITGARIR